MGSIDAVASFFEDFLCILSPGDSCLLTITYKDLILVQQLQWSTTIDNNYHKNECLRSHYAVHCPAVLPFLVVAVSLLISQGSRLATMLSTMIIESLLRH